MYIFRRCSKTYSQEVFTYIVNRKLTKETNSLIRQLDVLNFNNHEEERKEKERIKCHITKRGKMV